MAKYEMNDIVLQKWMNKYYMAQVKEFDNTMQNIRVQISGAKPGHFQWYPISSPTLKLQHKIQVGDMQLGYFPYEGHYVTIDLIDAEFASVFKSNELLPVGVVVKAFPQRDSAFVEMILPVWMEDKRRCEIRNGYVSNVKCCIDKKCKDHVADRDFRNPVPATEQTCAANGTLTIV